MDEANANPWRDKFTVITTQWGPGTVIHADGVRELEARSLRVQQEMLTELIALRKAAAVCDDDVKPDAVVG